MDKRVSIVMVGIGGYGQTHLKELLQSESQDKFYISGLVDPMPERSDCLKEIEERKIPIYHSLEDFYEGNKADLAIISSPIQFHCPQTVLALSKGTNVLCEKPVAATIQEVKRMIEARDRQGKFVAIGYQWSHSESIQSLKEDIRRGVLGKPIRLRTIVLWQRDKNYFTRSSWAGKKKDPMGNWILDSVANNATAHYLHNMFYVLGQNTDTSALPKTVTAELYRANDIENYDTAAFHITTHEGTPIYFIASHGVNVHLTPQFSYEFENARVVYGDPNLPESQNEIIAMFKDGQVKRYGNPENCNARKIWMAIDSLNGKNAKPLCGLEAASSHTIAINAAQESMPDIIDFPPDLVREDWEKGLVWVEGLDDDLRRCFENNKLPSQLDISWARAGKTINTENYIDFSG